MEPQLPVAAAATNAPAAAPEIGRSFIACPEDSGQIRVCTSMDELDSLDWEIVFTDLLLPKVAEMVLASDIKDYMALRGVCKPWRAATADPKLVGMDPRFYPWQWEMAKGDERTDDKARFGLLVLLASGWDMRLFNPVTGAVADLPNVFLESPPWAIEWNAAGLVEVIMHAKPGDVRWQIVDPLPALSESGLSVRGQFFLPTLEGNVLRYALRPQPDFVCVARQHARHRRNNNSVMRSFLQLARHRDGMMRMQLVRDILVVEHVDMDVEVLWVDVTEGSLTLVQQQDLADGDDESESEDY
ncbi:hypothetical protein VPH35_063493 [Triticum aestivum]